MALSGPDLAGRFIAARPLTSPDAARWAVDGVTDWLACAFAARQDPDVATLRRWARAESGDGLSRLTAPGGPTLLAPSLAALVGGLQAHALDLDDVQAEMRGHPSAVCLPALWALSGPYTAGSRFLGAYIIGVEVMARLGRALQPQHGEAGFHATGTLGAVGAAAAGAWLLEYDHRTAATAVSLACSQAAGLRLQFGTAAKPLQAGLAAQAAVQAVEWAGAGFPAEADWLHPERGFAATFGVPGDTATWWADLEQRPWAIAEPGLWFKRFTFCSAAMSAAAAALELAPQVDPERIEAVTVAFPAGADAALVHRQPAAGEQGRFSAEYVVALALGGHPLDARAFDSRPVEPAVAALAGRVTRSVLEVAGPDHRARPARVEVRMADGQVLTAQVDHPVGSPANPLSADDRLAKLAAAVGDDTAVRLQTAVASLKDSTLAPLQDIVAEVAGSTPG